jgi:hypothetical protein
MDVTDIINCETGPGLGPNQHTNLFRLLKLKPTPGRVIFRQTHCPAILQKAQLCVENKTVLFSNMFLNKAIEICH